MVYYDTENTGNNQGFIEVRLEPGEPGTPTFKYVFYIQLDV